MSGVEMNRLQWSLVSLDQKLRPLILEIIPFSCSGKFLNVTGNRGTPSGSNLTLHNMFIGKIPYLFALLKLLFTEIVTYCYF